MRGFLLESLERRDLMAAVPVALNDPLYATPVGADLVVSSFSSGVAANDYDVDSAALSASIVTNPAHGSLVAFASDGTFTYRPTSGYSGPDTFTYKISNGSFDSNVATASIQVGQVFGARTNLDDVSLAAPNLTGANILTQPLTLGKELVYNSITEPRPVVAVETSLQSGATVPDSIEAQLTFGGVVGSVVTYDTTSLAAGDKLRFVLQVDGSTLSTGYYDYTMTLTAKYTGGTDVVQTFSGSQAVVNRSSSEFGRGWWLDGLDRLVTSSAGALLVEANGDALWYKKNATGWEKAEGDSNFSTLAQSGTDYILTTKDGTVLNFNSGGYLTSLVDTNGNTTSFTYNGSNQLTTITDPFSRSFSLTYTSGNATSVSDFASRSSTLAYTSGKLSSVTLPDPDGTGVLAAPVYAYGYDATTNLLSSYTDPRSNTTSYSYDSTSRRFSQLTHPDTTTWSLVPVQTFGLKTGTLNTLVSPASVEGKTTDERNNDWKFLVDRFGNIISSTTPVSSTTVTLRDPSGLALKETQADPDGTGPLTSPITMFGYNSTGDLLKRINPDLTTLTYTYETSHHRVLTATDEVGRVTTMTYDTQGNMLTRQDNGGHTWTYTYTTRGLVASETSPDPDGAGPLSAYVTGYAYDTSGRLTTKTLPDSSTITYTYTTSDQTETKTNELGYTTTNTYDALDRLTSKTDPDPDGAGPLSAPVTSYEYDALGEVTKEVDPLGNETTHTYNNQNLRSGTTHPDPDGAGALSAPTDSWTFNSTGDVSTHVDSFKPLASDQYGYDAARDMTSQEGAGMASRIGEYDALGRLTRTNENGLDDKYQYDARGRVIEHQFVASVNYTVTTFTTTYTYNQAGQKTSETDANGHTTMWTYTPEGWLNSVIKPDPDGSGSNFSPTTTFGHDALGRVTSVTDANGNITNIEYNFRGQAIKLTRPDPDGSGSQTSPIATRAYNAAGWLTSITDPLSRVKSYTYDHLGRQLTETLPDPDGAGSLSAPVTTTAYNAAGWITSVTDPRGGVTSYIYDDLGRNTSVTEPDPDGAGPLTSPVTSYTYGSRGLASMTDPLGHTTTYSYDDDGNQTTVTDADGKTTTTVYDSQARVTSVTTPVPDDFGMQTESTTSYTYDGFGRLTRKENANNGVTVYEYDAVNNLIWIRDPVGNTTNYSYDALNRVTMETNALNDTRSTVYDAMGNLTRKTDRDGRVIQYDYDQLNRRTAEKWMSGTTQTPSVDISTTQSGGSANEAQTVGYSDFYGGFSGTFTLSFGGYTTDPIAFDASAATVQAALEALTTVGTGNVLVAKPTDTSTDQVWTLNFQGALGSADQSQVTIDTTGISSMSGSTTPVQTTETEGHGLRDEIQTVTLSNATGGTFRLAYRGQTSAPLAYNASAADVDSAIEALSTVGTGAVSVTLASSVYTVTFGGSLHNTNVDSLQGDVSTATFGTVDRTISTTYDADSEITEESDPAATINYTYDSLARVTSLVNTIVGLTPTVTFDQTFSTGSDRTQIGAKIGATNDFKTDYTFDTLGRMTDIVQQANSGNAVASKHVTLAYNKLGMATAYNRYESTGTTNQVASTDFTYDTLNRLTNIDHKQGTTVLASYVYSYDHMGRITSVDSSQDGLTNYSYDKVSQVTGADHTGQTDETFTFDDNGNRFNYTVSTNNLTTSDGTYNYAYDDEGNRTTKTKIADSSYTTYVWDYRDRLTAVQDYDGSGVLVQETTYAYDAHNRLIKTTYDGDGAGSGTATSRYWAFDEGINPLLEFDGSAATDVSHRYLWGPVVDQLFADEQPTGIGSAGNVLWALGDNIGTIRDIADLSGTTTSVTNHRRFGAYGNLISESNSAVDMLFAFTGKLYDENAKLQNNQSRWYDAAIGQWLSEDPIRFDGGDENLRRYVGNLVVSRSDPMGLWWWDGDWLEQGVGGLVGLQGDEVQAAAGQSIIDNPLRGVLGGIAQIDPTPVSPVVDVLINGTVEGRSIEDMGTDILINVMPGPPARVPSGLRHPHLPHTPNVQPHGKIGNKAPGSGTDVPYEHSPPPELDPGSLNCFLAGTEVAVFIAEAEKRTDDAEGIISAIIAFLQQNKKVVSYVIVIGLCAYAFKPRNSKSSSENRHEQLQKGNHERSHK